MNYKQKELADELDSRSDPLYLVIKGHLFIENELNKILEGFIPNPKILNLNKKGFYEKVCLAQSFNMIDEPVTNALLNFNDLRNAYAHNLNFNLSYNRVLKLKTAISNIDGMQIFKEEIVIGDKKGKLIDLKASLIALQRYLKLRAAIVLKYESYPYDLSKLDVLE